MFKQYKNTNYDIYDDGRCYSHLSNRFLKPKMSVSYPSYSLQIDGKNKQIKVHRMVAETFLERIEGKNIVNHKDGNTKNFDVSNLEWVSEKENSQHARNTGLIKKADQTINKYTTNLPGEEWKPLIDYPNYVISSVGRVMNIHTKRLIKPYKDNAGGYLCVSLWRNNKGKIYRIHKLVYSTFYEDYNLDNYVINHKDGNKENNDYKNLEKATYQQNNLHAIYVIKTNQSAKPIIQMDKNYQPIAEFNSISEAQRILNISNISRAIHKNGSAGGYYWKFK